MLLFITWNKNLRDRDSDFSMNLSTCIHCLTARHYKVRSKLGVWERKLCNMLYFPKIILIGLFFRNFAASRDSTNGNRRSKIRSRAWKFTQSMRLSSVWAAVKRLLPSPPSKTKTIFKMEDDTQAEVSWRFSPNETLSWHSWRRNCKSTVLRKLKNTKRADGVYGDLRFHFGQMFSAILWQNKMNVVYTGWYYS